MTLLEKAYDLFSFKTFKPYLKELCKDLEVELQVTGNNRGWVQVEIAGEDEAIELKYLERQVGFAPETIENVEKFSAFSGRVMKTKSKTELYVDIGVFDPESINAVIPLQCLQAQLADGKKLALQNIVALYGLDNNVPVHVKIVKVDKESGQIWAELSEWQLVTFNEWVRASVDRLLVLGSLRSYVDRAVKVSGHARDVIKIESLGLLDHIVICKLGTDAQGLIPRFGKYLRTASLVPFSPRKILELIDRM